jgi:hypothetical protein
MFILVVIAAVHSRVGVVAPVIITFASEARFMHRSLNDGGGNDGVIVISGMTSL